MRYLGGKQKLGKEISKVLYKHAPPDKVNGYCEPFCGALGVMRHMVDNGYKKCKAYDKCKDLILLWKDIKSESFTFPKKVSKQTWLKYKNKKDSSAMRGFIGFGCSFGGIWYSGYGEEYYKNPRYKKTNLEESIRSTQKLIPKIKKINTIGCKDYTKHKLKGYLIYCDPPYRNTLGYKSVNNTFDSDHFWEIIRNWSKDNIVIVSEYIAPKDFKCIWKKKRKESLNPRENNNKIEKLFILKKNYT